MMDKVAQEKAKSQEVINESRCNQCSTRKLTAMMNSVAEEVEKQRPKHLEDNADPDNDSVPSRFDRFLLSFQMKELQSQGVREPAKELEGNRGNVMEEGESVESPDGNQLI